MEEIRPELVLNWDQTGIHLIPAAEWMMDQLRSQRVEICGVSDKRQVTAVFCGSAIGDFLPAQITYQGKTKHCHPEFKFPIDWNVTHSPKHWSTEDTMVEYITKIIIPYIESVCSNLKKESAAAVVIMDNFKGEKTAKINKLLEENNLHVCLLPPNTTDKIQPMDVAVNMPVKDFLRRKSEQWYADQVMEQLHNEESSDTDSIKLQTVDFSMAQIKELSGQWLVEMHDYIASHPEFIVNDFVCSGITQALSESTSASTSEDDSEPGIEEEHFSEDYDTDNDGAEFSDMD